MIFKQVTLLNNSTIYFIDNKRATGLKFYYQYFLCNIENKKTYNSFIGYTRAGNRFYQCTKIPIKKIPIKKTIKMETDYKKAKKYLCEVAKDIKEKYKTDKPAQRM